jgi:hypothetical protein
VSVGKKFGDIIHVVAPSILCKIRTLSTVGATCEVQFKFIELEAEPNVAAKLAGGCAKATKLVMRSKAFKRRLLFIAFLMF